MFDFFKSKARRRSPRHSERRPDYAALRTSTEEERYEEKVSGESRRFLLWGSLLGVLVLFVAAFSLAVVNTSTPEPYAYERYDPRTKRCGDTAAEAKRLGCQFDPTTFSWLPGDCLDHELASEFRAREWTLYMDKNKTMTRTESEWSIDAYKSHQAWLTSKDSKLYCVFSWKRMHRAIMAGRNLPEGLDAWANTEHCGETLTSYMQPDDIALSVHITFPAC